jgi:hypothetical protein
MFTKVKNSKQQGNVGIGQAIAYFTKMGYTVCIPLTDSQNYDLIVENGTIQKVQVKTSNYVVKSGGYEVALGTCGGNQSFNTVKKFDPSQVDLLFITLGNGQSYCIPTSILPKKDRRTITIGKKYSEYKIR